MRSASSSTKVLTLSSLIALLEIKSSNRPGVATKISVPPRNASICVFADTPPKTATVLTAPFKCAA